jgi:hypothetical protein
MMSSKPSDLKAAKRLLKAARDLIADAIVIFRAAGQAEASGRLKGLADRLSDEIVELDVKLDPENAGGNEG